MFGTVLDAWALAMVKQLKLYTLSKAADPPQTHFIEMHGKVFDGIRRFYVVSDGGSGTAFSVAVCSEAGAFPSHHSSQD
jgi:hypothetical protein